MKYFITLCPIILFSDRREVLYKILIEFGIPKKLVRLIKMSLLMLILIYWEEVYIL